MIIILILILILIYTYTYNYTFVYIYKSKIHGKGLFVRKNFKKNSIIFKAIGFKNNKPKITYYGSYINHSYNPNTYLKFNKDGWYIYALKNINNHEELSCDYTHTPNFIDKPNKNWK